jgi:dGTPase
VNPPGSYRVRERLEAIEDAILAPWAAHSARSAGRERPEVESDVRTAYQRDRDRILHTNSFRRLRAKTQVFIAATGDHYATRLSHVLEVTQIGRVIARALALNEDLVEAISLGHDLGHAPFGHAGQAALDRLLHGGYRHDEQSLRVVQLLERDGRGLNLTREVLDGIRTHRKPRHSLVGTTVGPSTTLEADVVRIADAVAYINHDIDDSVRGEIIQNADLPTASISHLGHTRSQRINHVVLDIVRISAGKAEVHMSEETLAALDELREFLFQRVYTSPIVKREAERAGHVVTELFGYFSAHPDQMPTEYRDDPRAEGVERRVADYIAGMTDFFAIALFQELFVRKSWTV